MQSNKSKISCKQGFTLIELLVVVLIIGILAAVALPQYKLAVIKSRVSTMFPVIKSIVQAQELHYLKNGTYVGGAAVEKMDIDMPSSCYNTGNNYWYCGSDFGIDFSNQTRIILFYCPQHNTTYTNCNTNREYDISRFYNHSDNVSKAGTWLCSGKSQLGQKVCKSLVLR